MWHFVTSASQKQPPHATIPFDSDGAQKSSLPNGFTVNSFAIGESSVEVEDVTLEYKTDEETFSCNDTPRSSPCQPSIPRASRSPRIQIRYASTMAPKELNFITGNKNKLKEVQEILSQTPVELQSQPLDLPELQGTIEEITTDKCRRAADIVRGLHHTSHTARNMK